MRKFRLIFENLKIKKESYCNNDTFTDIFDLFQRFDKR